MSLIKSNSEQQLMTEWSSISDRHQGTEDHNFRSNERALKSRHSVYSNHAGTTGQTGSGRSVRPVPIESAASGHREERHDIIHIKVPRISSIFDKVRFASNLPNSQSDPIFLVDASTSDIIMSNPKRLTEEANLLASYGII
jgi:hypothetical protein